MNDEGPFRNGRVPPRTPVFDPDLASGAAERDWTPHDERRSVPHVFYHCQPIAKGDGYLREFDWSRGFEIPGHVRDDKLVMQTYAHTNWPKSQRTGLPMGWRFLVQRVAAICDRAALEHAEWLNDVAVMWTCEHKPFVQLSLAELVFGGRAVEHVLRQQLLVGCELRWDGVAPGDMRFWMRLEGRLRRED